MRRHERVDLVQWTRLNSTIMAKVVNVHEAKTNLSRLLVEVENGA